MSSSTSSSHRMRAGASLVPSQRAVPRLPTGPFLRVLEFLSAQDRACSGRLACRDAWRHLSGVHHRTAHLSQPLPPHAVPWLEHYGPDALKQLTFQDKLTRPMAAAAASGSTANLAAVWGLVRQGLHPELLQTGCYDYGCRLDSIEAVLVREGHAHLVPWLLGSGCPFNARTAVLAAAQHCDLAGLQAVWRLLQLYGSHTHEALAWAASSSSTEDALAKMDWLVREYEATWGTACIIPTAAVAATADLVLLRWMLQRGCDFNAYGDELFGSYVLHTAMRHAGLEVVEWLVREAGCQLPGPAPGPAAAAAAAVETVDERDFRMSLVDAAAASGSAAKLQWLRDRGLLPLFQPAFPAAMQVVMKEAAAQGQLETLRYLHEDCGVGLSDMVACAAVHSGEVAVASWILQQGGRELFDDRGWVWSSAAGSGSLDMVQWLVGEGMLSAADAVPAVHRLVGYWPSSTEQSRASLLAAVKLVLQSVAGPSGSGGGDGSGGGNDNNRRSGGDGGGGSGGSGSGGGGGDGGGGGGGGGGLAPGAIPGSRQQHQELLAVAAWRGDLPLFTYLHSQLQLQCAMGPEVLLEAVKPGCEALVEWLLGHGCALPEATGKLFLIPALRGDLAALRCLRRMGVPWPRGLLPEAVRHGCHLPMLQWLVAEGVTVGAGELAEAIKTAAFIGDASPVWEPWRPLDHVHEARQQASDVVAWLRLPA